jgi:hypothetical protein
MKLVCSSSTCQQVNDFSEPVIKSLFIAGINDMELQQDLLAEQGLTLEKAVQMAVARETAKSSQVILDSNQQVIAGMSTYKKGLKKFKVPPDCCLNCGQKKHSDNSDCPAKDNQCSCGITGHFRNICMYDGKPKRNQGGGKQETKGVEDKDKAETGHSINESCFGIMLEENTSATSRPGNRYKGRRNKHPLVNTRTLPRTTPGPTGTSSRPPPGNVWGELSPGNPQAPPSLAVNSKQPSVLRKASRNTSRNASSNTCSTHSLETRPADYHRNTCSMNTMSADKYEYKLLTDYELPPTPPVPS